MTKLTLETIGRTGFSYSFDSFEREDSTRSSRRCRRPWGEILARRADQRDEVRKAYMAEVVDEVIRARRTSTEPGPEDLLELMLRAARENDPNRIDELNIRHQVVTFLVAGHETTSGALSFALYYLSRNPDVLAKAQAEVDKGLGGRGARLREDRETSIRTTRPRRIAASVADRSAYSRAALEDTTLVGKYPMKKGDWMLVLIPSLHRDPCGATIPRLSIRIASYLPTSRPGRRTCTSRSEQVNAPASEDNSPFTKRSSCWAPSCRNIRSSRSGLRVEGGRTAHLMPEGFNLTVRRR
ncbi:unnamed protein product, partial [Mesorhabditis spiculigera]